MLNSATLCGATNSFTASCRTRTQRTDAAGPSLAHAPSSSTNMTSTDRIEAAYHPFEGGSVPRVRRQKSTSSWLTPARFCLALCFLLAGIVATVLLYIGYTVAATFWQIESAPHLDKHANASLVTQPIPLRDANVVRSFFGPKDAGGIDHFDLKAALWVKILKPDVHWFGESSASLSESPGTYE